MTTVCNATVMHCHANYIVSDMRLQQGTGHAMGSPSLGPQGGPLGCRNFHVPVLPERCASNFWNKCIDSSSSAVLQAPSSLLGGRQLQDPQPHASWQPGQPVVSAGTVSLLSHGQQQDLGWGLMGVSRGAAPQQNKGDRIPSCRLDTGPTQHTQTTHSTSPTLCPFMHSTLFNAAAHWIRYSTECELNLPLSASSLQLLNAKDSRFLISWGMHSFIS